MIKTLVLILVAAALTACERPQYPRYVSDRTERQSLFQQCLGSIPEGPRSTHYNDWSEVVDACENAAYRQSLICYENCPTVPASGQRVD